MFDFPEKKSGVHRFFENHAEGLQSAALLLGGRPKLRQVHGVLDALASSDRLTRRIRTAIDDILNLLTLRHVADESRSEAAYFAMLDPSQPYVEENCLLADGLQAELEAFDKSDQKAGIVANQKSQMECRQ